VRGSILPLHVRNALLNSLVLIPALVGAQTPVLQAAPVSVSFVATGQSQPPARQIRVRNTGSGSLQWRAISGAPWIRVSPAAGTGPAVLTIAVDATRLEPGRPDRRVTIDAGNADDSPVDVAVTAQIITVARVAGPPPMAPAVALVADAVSTVPASASYALDGPQGPPTDWRAVSDQAWLTVLPSGGTSPGIIQVEVSAEALAPGTYVATVTVTMEGAPNSPARIPLQVTVQR